MGEEWVRLCLEVVGGNEPISGWLDDGNGDRRAFEGWMELPSSWRHSSTWHTSKPIECLQA